MVIQWYVQHYARSCQGWNVMDLCDWPLWWATRSKGLLFNSILCALLTTSLCPCVEQTAARTVQIGMRQHRISNNMIVSQECFHNKCQILQLLYTEWVQKVNTEHDNMELSDTESDHCLIYCKLQFLLTCLLRSPSVFQWGLLPGRCVSDFSFKAQSYQSGTLPEPGTVRFTAVVKADRPFHLSGMPLQVAMATCQWFVQAKLV